MPSEFTLLLRAAEVAGHQWPKPTVSNDLGFVKAALPYACVQIVVAIVYVLVFLR